VQLGNSANVSHKFSNNKPQSNNNKRHNNNHRQHNSNNCCMLPAAIVVSDLKFITINNKQCGKLSKDMKRAMTNMQMENGQNGKWKMGNGEWEMAWRRVPKHGAIQKGRRPRPRRPCSEQC